MKKGKTLITRQNKQTHITKADRKDKEISIRQEILNSSLSAATVVR